MNGDQRLLLRVARKAHIADDVVQYELVSPGELPLPGFTAGAHLDVHIPGGLVRQYSLCNGEHETHRYVLGVLREVASRGGSLYMHATLEEGQIVEVSAPRNRFGLSQDSNRTLLIGGGIGITPLLSMAESLWRRGEAFELHYSVRTRARAAFMEQLVSAPYAQRVSLHLDDGEPTQRLDVRGLLADWSAGRHLYVCGPAGLIDAVRAIARENGWPDHAVHFELFSAGPASEAPEGNHPFDVRLASSGRIIRVEPHKTVVEALADAGVDIAVSCEQGVCGTCLTGVLAGVPDHRDCFLTDKEHAANDCFTPCCSRSLSIELTLDL